MATPTAPGAVSTPATGYTYFMSDGTGGTISGAVYKKNARGELGGPITDEAGGTWSDNDVLAMIKLLGGSGGVDPAQFMPVTVVTSTASSATPTPAVGTLGATISYELTALAAAAAFAAPTGTPVDGQVLRIRIKDNATARALTWNAAYRAIGITLPTTTVISKTMYIGCLYNLADSKWDVVSVAQEA